MRSIFSEWLVRWPTYPLSAVERVLHYATELEQEAPHFIDTSRPPPEWPSRGEMEFKDVVMYVQLPLHQLPDYWFYHTLQELPPRIATRPERNFIEGEGR